jgi:hypothetical protein
MKMRLPRGNALLLIVLLEGSLSGFYLLGEGNHGACDADARERLRVTEFMRVSKVIASDFTPLNYRPL